MAETTPEGEGDWAKTARLLKEQLLRRGTGPGYREEDAAETPPWEALGRLADAGARIDRGLITQITDEVYDVPLSLNAEHLHQFLRRMARRGNFGETSPGVGGELLRPRTADADSRTHTIYQLGGKADGGFLKAIRELRRDLSKRHDDGEPLEGDDLFDYTTSNSLLNWMKATAGRLKTDEDALTIAWHLVFYEEGGSLHLHRDVRLDDELALRCIFNAPPTAEPDDDDDWREERRLTYYIGQDKPPKPVDPSKPAPKKPRYGPGFDIEGALCLGKAGGHVRMKGGGAGGVELVPAGVVDLSGLWAKAGLTPPAVYIWHVPYIRTGAPAPRASYVVSLCKQG